MSWKSILDQAPSILISVKAVVANVPQPNVVSFCLGVSFFPLHFFFLLLTQNFWKQGIEFQLKSIFFCFHSGEFWETVLIG